MSDPFSQWVRRYQEDPTSFEAALRYNPNLMWTDYLEMARDGRLAELTAHYQAMSPMQRGPQWRTGGPMYGNGYASTEELYQALGRPGGQDLGAALEGLQKTMREREEAMRSLQDQLAAVSAERDQLKAVIEGPAWEAMEHAAAGDGPWAALATARATLVDAYKLREHAVLAATNADAKIVEIEQERAKYNRESADLAKLRAKAEADMDKAAAEYARTVQERSVLEAEHARLNGWVRAQRGMTAASVVLVLVWLGLIAWQTSEHWWPLI